MSLWNVKDLRNTNFAFPVWLLSHLKPGHYISDVFDCKTKQWTSYDDSTATKVIPVLGLLLFSCRTICLTNNFTRIFQMYIVQVRWRHDKCVSWCSNPALSLVKDIKNLLKNLLFILTVPLSTKVYERVLVNLMLGITLQWTRIPPMGEYIQIRLVTLCYENRWRSPVC